MQHGWNSELMKQHVKTRTAIRMDCKMFEDIPRQSILFQYPFRGDNMGNARFDPASQTPTNTCKNALLLNNQYLDYLVYRIFINVRVYNYT